MGSADVNHKPLEGCGSDAGHPTGVRASVQADSEGDAGTPREGARPRGAPGGSGPGCSPCPGPAGPGERAAAAAAAGARPSRSYRLGK